MIRPPLPVTLAALALICALAGCGSGRSAPPAQGTGGGSTVSVGSATTTPAATGATTSPSPGTSASTTAGPGPAATSATSTSTESQVMFSSPSKNIACWMEGVDVRCDIAQHAWTAPPKPASCPLDYGNGLSLHAGVAQLVCAGDTVLGQPRILAYGSAIAVGRDVCTSLQAGMRCVDQSTGHGFLLSRESYALF